LNFFWKKKRTQTITKVPNGTFRCEICGFVHPSSALCGTVTSQHDVPPRQYTLCGCCSLWLGLGTARFPSGTTPSLSLRQQTKIKSLLTELDKCGGFDKAMMQITTPATMASSTSDYEKTHVILEDIPTLKSLIKFRFSMLSVEALDISTRLTRGETVTTKEIKQANGQ